MVVLLVEVAEALEVEVVGHVGGSAVVGGRRFALVLRLRLKAHGWHCRKEVREDSVERSLTHISRSVGGRRCRMRRSYANRMQLV